MLFKFFFFFVFWSADRWRQWHQNMMLGAERVMWVPAFTQENNSYDSNLHVFFFFFKRVETLKVYFRC